MCSETFAITTISGLLKNKSHNMCKIGELYVNVGP